MNKLFVISGPSGVGKGTLVKHLLKRHPELTLSISCTTRKPREGEVDGREYFFITKKEFKARIKAGDFLEYDKHFGKYYGTPRSFVEQQFATHSVILEIDVVGGFRAKEQMPEQTSLIMILPPSEEELARRLAGRKTESARQCKKRLKRMRFELAQKDKYEHFIVNDTIEEAVKELERVMEEETNRE